MNVYKIWTYELLNPLYWVPGNGVWVIYSVHNGEGQTYMDSKWETVIVWYELGWSTYLQYIP